MPTIDIVITSYNGKSLLEKQLPIVLKNSPQADQVIVVDDASTDGTVDFLNREFPRIKCIYNVVNQGFTKTTNLGVGESKADLVVLLNSDVYPQPNYLDSASKFFTDPKIFAVSFNETNSSWPKIEYRGKIEYTRGVKNTTPILSAWASGGSCIVRRSLWQALNGFDPIFSPGYWEDIDLGWRAWRMGYKIIWDPDSTVTHKHESTFSKLSPSFVTMVKQRNELLFNWKNITDPTLVGQHLLFLIKHTITHPGYLKVIISALNQISHLRRLKNTPFSDEYILHTVNRPLEISG